MRKRGDTSFRLLVGRFLDDGGSFCKRSESAGESIG